MLISTVVLRHNFCFLTLSFSSFLTEPRRERRARRRVLGFRSPDLRMGPEMAAAAAEDGDVPGSLEARPGVFLIGAPNVGKRTLLSRLLSVDLPETSDLSSGILCQGWTIETKYYSANVSIWTTNLGKGFSFRTLPYSKQLAALVMVFDLNDESSFTALQDWIVSIDIKRFDILLCIGNKADLVPGHYAHSEYRRYLQKHGESSSDPHPEYFDYGIQENEACSLLGDEEPSLEVRKLCSEWCLQYNIEFIEACASDAVFDKCLSVDGDIQGVERLYGALSAHMWPGMILKSGNMISAPFPINKEELTDDESDYEIEYEVLSGGSEEQWDHAGDSNSFFNPYVSTQYGFDGEVQIRDDQVLKHGTVDNHAAEDCLSTAKEFVGTSSTNDVAPATGSDKSTAQCMPVEDQDQTDERDESTDQVSTSEIEVRDEHGIDVDKEMGSDEDPHFGFDDLEKLMSDITGMRDNLRLMPDFQRREMAAKLALKMAAMFSENSDDGF